MSIKNYRSIIIQLFALLLFIELTGCKKFIQINPPATQITAATVYSNNTSAAAVMTGIYSNMMANTGITSGNYSISYLEGLAADELQNYSTDPTLSQFYQNALTSSTGGASNVYYWGELYNEIHVANAVIEGLANSTAVTPAINQQLNGEAKFMRAFLHFYAVNLYGDVPLVTTTNYLTTNSISRTPSADVYKQIIQDLKDAQADLSDKYLNAYGVVTTAKTRPNKGAAEAMLARAYLYTGDWVNAQAEADSVINNAVGYRLDSNLNQVFLGNSSEAIWQLIPVNPGYNTYDGYYFVLTSPPGSGQYSVALSTNLINAFEVGDGRFTNWVGSYTSDSVTYYYYPYKYKIGVDDPSVAVTEYAMVLRLAEQYLIRAEAEAEGAPGGLTAAIADLNAIRSRAGLGNYSGPLEQTSVLTAIRHERQVELFTEWGHRWLDLKRTGTVNSVMGAPGNVCMAKGGNWNTDWALMPLPLGDVQIDPNLKQNPGYE